MHKKVVVRLFITSLALATQQSRSVLLEAQSTALASKSASISVGASLQKDKIAVNEGPWVILTVKNIGNRDVSLGPNMNDYRVHVEGEKGEPPKTPFHRMIRGEFQPGDRDLAGSGLIDDIPPGKSLVHKFNLTFLYNLSVPSKYTAYIEVQDKLSGTWLRTNTVQFTIQEH